MIPIHRLAYVADSLLALIPRDQEYPHYSEHAFQRKLFLASQRDRSVQMRQADPAWAYLLDREWSVIAKRAKLTDRQQEVFALRIMGWTFESIGNRYGHSKQGAQNIFNQAIRKVFRARDIYVYAGLAEIYRQEVRRGR